MKKKIVTALISMLLLCAILLSGCSGKGKVVIASKEYSENVILGEMLAQLVEKHTDLEVERKLMMGGTFVCFEAIKNGDIDIYPEYTGTGLTSQLKMDVINDPDEAYRVVAEEFDKQFGIKWLDQFGFNNTYTLAVTPEAAEKYKLETYSDLAAVSDELVFGGNHEFFNRQDGYDGLIETYGITFKSVAKMNATLRYQAIGDGQMDATNAFSTDGQLKQYELKVLIDDKNFFPPYYGAPIVRNDTLKKYPELEAALNKLGGQIDDETMTALNYEVDVQKREIAEVATEFLKSKGLV